MTRAPKAWTFSELKALLTITKAQDYRMYVFFLLSVFHGLRVSETLAIRRKDFSQNLKLRTKRLKGSLATEQALQGNADPLLDEKTVIDEYISRLDSDDLLFTDKDGGPLSRFQAYSLVKRFCCAAGIEESRAHPHCAKHSLGRLMFEAGCPIKEIQIALGHVNINSTAMYMLVSETEADDARARAFAATGGN